MIGKIVNYIYLLFFYFFTNISFANFENSIIIKIDNQIITNFEIKNKILSNLILSNKEINQLNIDSLKKKSVDSLIQSKIKSIEVNKYNLTVNKLQIDQYLNSITSDDIKSLKNKFIINNLDFELFLKDIETEFRWQKLIYEIYSKNISIDDKQIEFELKKLIKESKNLIEYNLSEIEIFIDDNDQIDEKISDIKNSINQIGFEQTALNKSMSSTSSRKGSIGWVNSKALSKDILDILKNIKKGDISKPLIKQSSILFLKINEIRTTDLKKINIIKLKEEIINRKKNELFNLYSKSHLSRIKNNSFIEYK